MRDKKPVSNGADADAGLKQILEFRLRDQRYAVDILAVTEVIPRMAPTRVFHAPAFVLGIVNLRGNIVALLDMASFFELPPAELTEESRVLVLQSRATGALTDAGFLVDRVIGSRQIDPAHVFPPPLTIRGVQREFITGVLEEEGGPLILLSADQIFASEKVSAL